jgi:long-chain acyl-CoA synthetase
MYISSILRHGAEKTPDKIAIYYYDQTYTYHELDQLVSSLAQGFTNRLGLSEGDVIAIQSSNTIEFVLTLFACWRLGVALTPLNPALKIDEIHYQLSDSGAKCFIYDSNVAEKARSAVESLAFTPQCIIFNNAPELDQFQEIRFKDLYSDEAVPPPSCSTPELTALIIYTSGTTGKPKGVVLNHHNVNIMSSMLIEALCIEESDRSLLVLPLFHVNAIMCTLTVPILQGGSVVLRKRFVLEEFLSTIEKYRPTYTSAVPTIYGKLANLEESIESKPDLSSLRFGICGAAPIPLETFNRFERKYPLKLIEGWGLSECTMAATLNPLNGTRKVGSIGIPLPNQQVKVIDELSNELPPMERGELIILGENVMQGYLNQPEETKRNVKNGWLYSGDIGYKDKDGYLYIVDRKKDLIIRGGLNIYPKEIEEVIYTLEDVVEAAVVGIPHQDFGEEVRAFIAIKNESLLTESSIISYCKEKLANYKCPKEVVFLESLPKNSMGKITKGALHEF